MNKDEAIKMLSNIRTNSLADYNARAEIRTFVEERDVEIERLSNLLYKDCSKCHGVGRLEITSSTDESIEDDTLTDPYDCPHCNGTGKIRRWIIQDKFVKRIVNAKSVSDIEDYLLSNATQLDDGNYEIEVAE